MAYAIFRTQKLKNYDKIKAVEGHHTRTHDVKNADALKSHKNIDFIDRNAKSFTNAIKDRIGDRTIRKNAVLAVEVLMTASPSYFRDDEKDYGLYDQQKTDAFTNQAMAFLKKEFGERNIISAICHLDEATPHIQAVIVPIDPTSNKLNASYWLDGPKKMSELQDRFFEATQSLGLERGIKGSKATHTTIQDFYASLECQDILTPPIGVLTPPLALKASTREEWAKDESFRLEEDQQQTMRPIFAKAAVSVDAQKRARQSEATSKRKVEELEQMKKQAKLIREMDLVPILEKCGAKRIGNADGQQIWGINPSMVDGKPVFEHISLERSTGKFFNHYKNMGGGGAIDLVMHLEGLDFTKAISWLGGNIDKNQAIGSAMVYAKKQAEAAIKKPAPLPEPADQHWPHVRNYLISERGLNPKLVDKLHERGRLYADFLQNACFRYGSTSVERSGTRGVRWKGFAGVKAEGFVLKTVNDSPGAVFVESAIDALSFMDLRKKQPELAAYKDYDVIAVAGTSTQIVTKLSKEYNHIIIAFDRDKNHRGDEAFEEIKTTLNKAERLTPAAPHKDWNDYMKPEEPESNGGDDEQENERLRM